MNIFYRHREIYTTPDYCGVTGICCSFLIAQVCLLMACLFPVHLSTESGSRAVYSGNDASCRFRLSLKRKALWLYLMIMRVLLLNDVSMFMLRALLTPRLAIVVLSLYHDSNSRFEAVLAPK
jgi:hypothetical protein